MKLTLEKNKDGEPILREKNPYEKFKNEPNMDNAPVINPAWKLFESNASAKPLIGEYPEGRTEFDSEELEYGVFQVENGKNVHTDLGKTIKGYDLVEGYRYKPVGGQKDINVTLLNTHGKSVDNCFIIVNTQAELVIPDLFFDKDKADAKLSRMNNSLGTYAVVPLKQHLSALHSWYEKGNDRFYREQAESTPGELDIEKAAEEKYYYTPFEPSHNFDDGTKQGYLCGFKDGANHLISLGYKSQEETELLKAELEIYKAVVEAQSKWDDEMCNWLDAGVRARGMSRIALKKVEDLLNPKQS